RRLETHQCARAQAFRRQPRGARKSAGGAAHDPESRPVAGRSAHTDRDSLSGAGVQMRLTFKRIGRMAWRIGLRIFVALLIVAVSLIIAGILVVRSGWFYEKVRERIITEMSHATGGRVELGTFAFDWTRMEASVGSLVIHGREAEGETPLVQI